MPEKQARIASLQDLADLAGVSRATASRALADNPRIALATRQKIQRLAREHSYSINRRARDLRLQRNSLVSVVFMLDTESKQRMSDTFFLDMLGSIADALGARDYDLLLAHAPIFDAADLAHGRVMSQSDGVIFIGQEKQHEKLNQLATGKVPIVVWGQPVAGKNYTVVGGDNFKGGYEATRHLLNGGRRRIAFFGTTSNPENSARFAGYRQALLESDVHFDSSLQIDMPASMDQAAATASRLLDERKDFDAVVCVSDVMALATISALNRQGLVVPDDVAITGYDDVAIAGYSRPTLTTVRQNTERAGKVIVDTLLRLIAGEQPGDTMLPVELLIRDSSVEAKHPQNTLR